MQLVCNHGLPSWRGGKGGGLLVECRGRAQEHSSLLFWRSLLMQQCGRQRAERAARATLAFTTAHQRGSDHTGTAIASLYTSLRPQQPQAGPAAAVSLSRAARVSLATGSSCLEPPRDLDPHGKPMTVRPNRSRPPRRCRRARARAVLCALLCALHALQT